MADNRTRSRSLAIVFSGLGALFLALLVAGWAGAPAVADDEGPVVVSGSGLFALGEGEGKTAYMGVQLEEEVDDPEGGARVTHVVEDSPAAEAGLQVGDVIVEFAGRVIRGPGALTKQIHTREPGDSVKLKVRRDGGMETLELELGKRANIWTRVLPGGGVAWSGGEGEGYTVFDPEVLQKSLEPLERLKLQELEVAPLYNFYVGSGKARLGVQLVETTPELRLHLGGSEEAGVIVSKVLAGTPAEYAGLQVGDLIVAIGGDPVKNSREIRHALRDKVGETFEIEVIRDGNRQSIDVTIAAPDDDRPTGPRAYRVGPGGKSQIAEALRAARRAEGQSRRAAAAALREANRSAARATRDAARALREAQRSARDSARDALRRALELQRSSSSVI